eukprot:645100-Amphidinium_carterae.1
MDWSRFMPLAAFSKLSAWPDESQEQLHGALFAHHRAYVLAAGAMVTNFAILTSPQDAAKRGQRTKKNKRKALERAMI